MITCRREFLKAGLGIGAVAYTGLSRGTSQDLVKLPPLPVSNVSLAYGSDRRLNVFEVLKPFEPQIRAGIQGKRIIIKPNIVVPGVPLAVVHADAIRGVLDFLKTITDQTIYIGESSAGGSTMAAFESNHYTDLTREYNVKLVDLNTEPWVEVSGFDTFAGPSRSLKIIRPFLNRSSYIISVARPKTHDTVIATLTTKNILMAAPLRVGKSRGDNHKIQMHGGRYGSDTGPVLTKNIFLLANRFLPQFAVVDGLEGLEGEGPVRGTPVNHGFAAAGTDCIAVDRFCANLMGIDPGFLPYLQWCGNAGLGNYDPSRIAAIGPHATERDRIVKYSLHKRHHTETAWINSWHHHRHYYATPALGASSTVVSGDSDAAVRFALPERARVRLDIIDSRGRRIRTLADAELDKGQYSAAWDGRDDYSGTVANGTYALRLTSGRSRLTDALLVAL